jgi:putative toxin-antitoxin system antitoxin component (TIGR02293 family)
MMTQDSNEKTTAIKASEIFAKYERKIKDSIAIVKSSREGVGTEIFFDLVALSDLNKESLADELLGISLKTILRYAREGKPLLPRHAESALKLMALYKKGVEIFGNKQHFNRWLQKPAIGLGGQIPMELLGMTTGIDLVLEELVRIEFGALA